jgi:hypothetical protein
MASQTLQPESRPYVKEALKALHRHGLHAGFRDEFQREKGSGVELVKAHNTTPIDVTSKLAVKGHWTLHLSWTIRQIPRGEAMLWQSSFGLSIEGLCFAPADSRRCLVRYDVDNDRRGPGLEPLGAHLNILQPEPLDDHIHFPVLAGPERRWTVSEVIDVFLADEFVAELRSRLNDWALGWVDPYKARIRRR